MYNLYKKQKVVFCCWNHDTCGGFTRYIGDEYFADCGQPGCSRDIVMYTIPNTTIKVCCDRSEIPIITRAYELTGSVDTCDFVDLVSCDKVHYHPSVCELESLKLLKVDLTIEDVGETTTIGHVDGINSVRSTGVGDLCRSHVACVSDLDQKRDKTVRKGAPSPINDASVEFYYLHSEGSISSDLKNFDIGCNVDKLLKGEIDTGFTINNSVKAFKSVICKYSFGPKLCTPDTIQIVWNFLGDYDHLVNKIKEMSAKIDTMGVTIGKCGTFSICRGCKCVRRTSLCGMCGIMFCLDCRKVEDGKCTGCENVKSDKIVRGNKKCADIGDEYIHVKGWPFKELFLRKYITTYGETGIHRNDAINFFNRYFSLKLINREIDKMITNKEIRSQKNVLKPKIREYWELPFGMEDEDPLNYFQDQYFQKLITHSHFETIMKKYGVKIERIANNVKPDVPKMMVKGENGIEMDLPTLVLGFLYVRGSATNEEIISYMLPISSDENVKIAIGILETKGLASRIKDKLLPNLPEDAGVIIVNDGKKFNLTNEILRLLKTTDGIMRTAELRTYLNGFNKDSVDFAMKFLKQEGLIYADGESTKMACWLPESKKQFATGLL